MSTTLPLFWDLSSSSRDKRIDASVKLLGALEQFQAQHVVPESSSDDEVEEEETAKGPEKEDSVELEKYNAQDVAYSLRRLIRGLASPRDSSRLGFAVALTELLSKIDTVSCSQILALVISSSQVVGSMKGQEERDMLFARLFGLTALIDSGLVVRDSPLPHSTSSTTYASSSNDFAKVLSELIALGDTRSWIRESCWWTISLAIDALIDSSVRWKAEASSKSVELIFVPHTPWTGEKIALALKMQLLFPNENWSSILSPTFKSTSILSAENLQVLARILKQTGVDEEEEEDKVNQASGGGFWKPQLHFVWDAILDRYFSPTDTASQVNSSFPDFFRIVVDEGFFSSISSAERKYTGFEVFRKALSRATAKEVPLIFTKNLMRSLINHLSGNDRALHKMALQVAKDMHAAVEKSPELGFPLVLQLTGVHGNQHFDRITKTKTLETITAAMNAQGINDYVDHLLDVFYSTAESAQEGVQAPESTRVWVVEQLSALVRNGTIPKSEVWLHRVLEFLGLHAFFEIKKLPSKPTSPAIRALDTPLSDALRELCRIRLLSCASELINQSSSPRRKASKSSEDDIVQENEPPADKIPWVTRTVQNAVQLENDKKHFKPLVKHSSKFKTLRDDTMSAVERLQQLLLKNSPAAQGCELLLMGTLLELYANPDDEAQAEKLEICLEASNQLLFGSNQAGADETNDSEEAHPAAPIDVLVDTIIYYLEKGSAYLRIISNVAFSLLSGDVRGSTVELILTQLERRDPTKDMDEGDSSDEGEDGSEPEISEEEQSDEDDENEEAPDAELRAKVEKALGVQMVEQDDEESSEEEEAMDDDQMMQLDENLAEIFRSRREAKNSAREQNAQREATHFKNRVLDLVEIYIKKQSTSKHLVLMVIPLVEAFMDSGSDEKQFTEKIQGLLRNRLGKAKALPKDVDVQRTAEALEHLHALARRTHSKDQLATINVCSIQLSRILVREDHLKLVTQSYRDSFTDFVTRKNSSLTPPFFMEMCNRLPEVAWNMRDDLVRQISSAINSFRQAQVFQFIQTMLGQIANGKQGEEFEPFVRSFSDALYTAVTSACQDDKSNFSADHLRDICKAALRIIRLSRNVLTPAAFADIWDSSKIGSVSQALQNNTRFKTSGAAATWKGLATFASTDREDKKNKNKNKKGKGKEKVPNEPNEEDGQAESSGQDAAAQDDQKPAKAKKRKTAPIEGEDEEEGSKKSRRKKVKKSKE
ncbi:hypothetical protein SISSUDRAFT_1057190 [Sistotremastrum suecicum HHB10207 ss-3]|uniref:DNA polymerase V n=1 Tax=Sistotremastrum suecicum HHB10207 ss-3 TaxID=1314776 RepID=A0A166IYS2_9AGAM|nr:hypothetical protein SISSUDRAFT_1057190 [Sistotremastrum suecicum HHB10207 ss-3]